MNQPSGVPPEPGSGRPPQPDQPPGNSHHIILCERADEVIQALPGSRQRHCERCGVPILVSSVGLTFSAENSAELVCINCGLDEDWEGETAEPVPGTPSRLWHSATTKQELAHLQDIVSVWRRGQRN